MPALSIEGFNLYYEVHGEGFPLVLAHGIGGNHASWYQQVPVFAERYRTIVFDHRGFGNSRDRADGPGRSRFVADLAALLDHLEIRQAALVAQSMGGGTCALFTVKHPERVKALVLADTLVGLQLPPALQEQAGAAARAADRLSQLERVLSASFRERNPAGRELYSAIASFNGVDRKSLTGALGAGATLEQLGAAGVPILFLMGAEDAVFPAALVAQVQKQVRGSRYVEIPHAGHSVYFESPAAFNEAVLRFLSDTGVK